MKKILVKKAKPSHKEEEYARWRERMRDEVQRDRKEERRMLYIDEVVFSQATTLQKAWAAKGENIEVRDKRNLLETQAVIAAISVEAGLEAFLVKKRSINTTDDFCRFVEDLR